MKNIHTRIAVSLVAIAVLIACGKKEPQPASQPSRSSSSAISESKSSSTEIASSSTDNSTTTPSSSSEPAATPEMNVDEVSQGNFSSIVGTWRNSAGQEITFDEQGLATTGLTLGQYGDFSSGVFTIGIQVTESGTGFALMMIPKGTSIPDTLFAVGNDTSDINQDRMVGTQALLDGNTFDPYYRVAQ